MVPGPFVDVVMSFFASFFLSSNQPEFLIVYTHRSRSIPYFIFSYAHLNRYAPLIWLNLVVEALALGVLYQLKNIINILLMGA